MTETRYLKAPQYPLSFIFLAVLLACVQPAFADGVFLKKQKSQHELSGVELNRIKAEHQIRFGKSTTKSASFNSNNPWERKKQAGQGRNNANWGECREYALQKRNLCYREGRDAYHCEQVYEARTGLCDSTL